MLCYVLDLREKYSMSVAGMIMFGEPSVEDSSVHIHQRKALLL